METTTTILLSVLSTLSVVAVITIVVVSFMKLRRRVDSNNDECFRAMDSTRMDLENRIHEVTGSLTRESEEIRRIIDSRCDKLDSKIKSLSNVSGPVTSSETKQVLQG
jgi:Na+/H+ antiporter NhaB